MVNGLLPISASWLEFAVGIDPTHWIDRQNLNERAAGFALDINSVIQVTPVLNSQLGAQLVNSWLRLGQKVNVI